MRWLTKQAKLVLQVVACYILDIEWRAAELLRSLPNNDDRDRSRWKKTDSVSLEGDQLGLAGNFHSVIMQDRNDDGSSETKTEIGPPRSSRSLGLT